MIERLFFIVLDSFGCGASPDAESFGDAGSNTLRSVASSKYFNADNLGQLGLFNIEGNDIACRPDRTPAASFGRASELSAGKDTIIGHWELAGLVSPKSLPTYPNGFPNELLARIESATGVGCLCNKPYSGTDVIRDYGMEHIETGKPIVYTSVDSVYQVAAHEKYFGLDKLYEYCTKARELLSGIHGVGRVIARPFTGESPETFTRTANRHDYSLQPPGTTLLDKVAEKGLDVISVGKINDIFAGRSITEKHPIKSNADGMAVTGEIAARNNWKGLCMVNLVDFDMLWGHRNDIDGYARGIAEFDTWLGRFLMMLRRKDALIITADHGCDPATESTDHSREYIPVLVYGKSLEPIALGTMTGFDKVGEIAEGLLL